MHFHYDFKTIKKENTCFLEAIYFKHEIVKIALCLDLVSQILFYLIRILKRFKIYFQVGKVFFVFFEPAISK